MVMDERMKVCPGCDEAKSLDAFGARKRWPDGSIRTTRTYCRPCANARARSGYPSRATERKYPRAPFSAWIVRLVEEARADYDWNPLGSNGPRAELQPEARVAARLGVGTETLRSWRRARDKNVSERVVDEACTAEGSTHIGDIYPEYWAA